MEIIKGEKGVSFSHQHDFPLTVTCSRPVAERLSSSICGGEARIAFVAYEGTKEESYVCDMHENKEGERWVHDAMAVAIYLCKKCLKPVAICNQG